MMLRFQKVSFGYFLTEPVLDEVDLRLGSGLILFAGPNGCGKSTFLKIAAGVEKPDSGHVFIFDRNLWTDEVGARQNLAYLPEQPDLTPYASIREILNLVCRLRKEPLIRGEEALKFFGLVKESAYTVRELSMGQRRRAVFATCLIGRPRILLLDEPLEGMDLAIQEKILDWIDMRVREGVLIIVVSHVLPPFMDRATGALSLSGGKVKIFKSLPAGQEKRTEFFENLAKGYRNP